MPYVCGQPFVDGDQNDEKDNDNINGEDDDYNTDVEENASNADDDDYKVDRTVLFLIPPVISANSPTFLPNFVYVRCSEASRCNLYYLNI